MQNLAQHSIIWLYRSLLLPLALFALVPGLLLSQKLRLGLVGRWKQQRTKHRQLSHPPRSPRILIHAASGEFEYAKPVIRALKAKLPSCHITATYFSPSYAKNVHSFAELDEACYLPLDLNWTCRRFLHNADPDLVLIARTDLWPEWLWQCHQQKVPVWLFSVTKNLSKSKRPLLHALSLFPYSLLEEIHCVSHKDGDQLVELGVGAEKVFVSGDTRFDQALSRLTNPKPLREELRPQLSQGAILIAGSTWPQDEQALILAAQDLLHTSQLRLIIAPHEPSSKHLQELEILLKNKSLDFERYSECPDSWTTSVLIVDQVGILADLYSWGDLAFVGGSFKGPVHSVMEPLATGLLTLVGPHHHNNREALEFKGIPFTQNLSMVMACDNSENLRQVLEQVVRQNLAELRQSRALIQAEVKSRSGASSKLVDRVVAKLQSASKSQ